MFDKFEDRTGKEIPLIFIEEGGEGNVILGWYEFVPSLTEYFRKEEEV